MTETQWKLVESHDWLIARIARQFPRKHAGVIDVAGQDALIAAAAKFDPSKGFKFSTYAGRSIWRAMRRAVLLDARTGVVTECEVAGRGEYVEPVTEIEQRVEPDAMSRIWSLLNARERSVIHARFFDYLDYRTLAQRFEYASVEVARQTVYEILRRVRKMEVARGND